jgi:CcmD family protein
MLLLLLLQDSPAETTGYMIAGYAVIFGLMLFYLISLVMRRRNLEQDLEVLEDLQKRD